MSKVINSSRISNKLIIPIILFSSLITLFITLVQLYFEYTEDLNFLNKNITNIETGYKEGITNALWLDDKQQLIAILNGINALPDIEYIEVQVNSELYANSGKRVNDKVINSSFLLKNRHNDKLITIGKVFVEANLSGIYHNLLARTWTLLISNAIKTFLVVIFMYFLFDRIVLRRLHKIFNFVQHYDIHNLDKRLKIQHTNPDTYDEITEITNALNEMQNHLSLSLSELFQLKSTLDLSLDAVVIFHPENYKFYYVNTGASKLLGYDIEQLVGMKPADIIHNYSEQNVTEWINHTVNNPEHAIQLETVFVNKKGTEIPVRITLQYMNPGNEEPRFVFIARDITKRKEDEKVLLQSLENAKSANIAKSNFMMSMSHELRTPLNAILGFSQLLELDADNLTQVQNNSVSDIIKGGRHLLSIIEEILDLTSIESDNTTLSFIFIDPVNLLNDCFKIVSPIAELKNITLENKVTSSLPRINIDQTRFKQVIINLLSNAIKYNKQSGSVTLTYDLLENSIIRFKISDTGCGIKEEDFSHVFVPFNRLGHEGGNIEGTGIGLNITQKLVALMNGRIDFQSRAGEGSVFWVDFPYCSDAINEETESKKYNF